MAVTLTITISTADTNRVIHALCKTTNQTETAANAKQAVINYIIGVVRNIEMTDAQAAAAQTVNANADVVPS